MTSPPHPLSAATAIVGLGFSEIGRTAGPDATTLAVDAVRAALADAGLSLADVDGLITSQGLAGATTSVAPSLGLTDLRLGFTVDTAGASAATAVQIAATALAARTVDTVVYVHSDCPLGAGRGGGALYGAAGAARAGGGLASLRPALGLSSPNTMYAMAARRHMEAFGTTSDQLGAVAVGQRQWAAHNPRAQLRTPISLADHQDSRMICDPFHLLDCCLVSNGAIAVVMTRADRAATLPRPPVYLWGWGQGHVPLKMHRGSGFGLRSGAAIAGPEAFAMAGIGPAQIGVRELYDCYTFTVLLTLEDYGFVDRGESGPLATSGALGPQGALPSNTGGGQLSSFYLWGATPLSEAVIQARGEGGARQVADHDFVLCSGNGGLLEHHATLILSPHARRR